MTASSENGNAPSGVKDCFPYELLIACEIVLEEPCLYEEKETMKSSKCLLVVDVSGEGGSEGSTGGGLSPASICTSSLILG